MKTIYPTLDPEIFPDESGMNQPDYVDIPFTLPILGFNISLPVWFLVILIIIFIVFIGFITITIRRIKRKQSS